MKKQIVLAALALALILMTGFGTMAYFTSESTATNVITTGSVGVEIKETSADKSGEEIPFTSPAEVMPGGGISKIVRVENTGNQPAFIRVSLTYKALTEEGEATDSPNEFISPDIDEEMWIEKDGFYYYKDIVGPGKETEPLFTEVVFSPQMGNEYMNARFILDVKAQGVQSANNGFSSTEAVGFPME